MEWSATARYRLPGAPGGLGFVQDLLNTRSTRRGDKPDLLSELSSAQRWPVESGVAQPPVALDGNDLDKLRDLRADLHLLVSQAGRDGAGPAIPSATLGARTTPDGEVLLEPRGEGFRRLAGIVLIEMFNAQRSDAWRRIKVCRNERCAVSFFDRSRNNSGVWHDARACGNAANLRASRARKRQHQLAVARDVVAPELSADNS
jgi:CGNR zinc finger/Putative stress-induced transcription regulator